MKAVLERTGRLPVPTAEAEPWPAAACSERPAIKLSGVSKTYDGGSALCNVDLEVAPGSTVVLLGANGAGKSTLLGVVAGLIAPSEGEISIHGQQVKRSYGKGGIGVVGHDTMLFERLTGRENLELHASLAAVAKERVGQVLAHVDLCASADRQVNEYSHGMRKRLALARALLQQPALLVLDEPFSGLDRASQETLSKLLKALPPTTTVLFSTHDADKAVDHGDRLVTLHEGRVMADEPCRSTLRQAGPVRSLQEEAGGGRGLKSYLSASWLVLRKDLLVEARTRSVSSAMLVFAGLLATVLGMAFQPLAAEPLVLAGVLWILITFAAMHGLARSFDGDFKDDGLRGLVLTGADPAAIYLGKVLSNSLMLLLVSLTSLALIAIFFGTPDLVSLLPGLLALIALAALGLTAVGGLLTVISRHTSLGETLLPILFLPLVVPVLLAGIGSVPVLLETGSLDGGWVRVLIFYAIGMSVAATAFFEHLLEA